MRINTNVNSMNAIESGTNNSINARNSLEKLSSGLQINKASDDASGLAIADKLRTQKTSLNQSIDNANSAVSMIQIADKAMAEQSNILDIVKTKLIQGSTATTSTEGLSAIGKDIAKLLTQLDNIASQTNYNGVSLLQNGINDKTATSSLEFQMGEKSDNKITTSGSVRANTIGLSIDALLSDADAGGAPQWTADKARSYMDDIDLAIDKLNTYRSDFGSTQNQIESATRNMLTAKTNIAAAESVIRDVDYAEESANFNKLNIIGNASTYAQSQANAVPQSILKLLN
jgi:flagellin